MHRPQESVSWKSRIGWPFSRRDTLPAEQQSDDGASENGGVPDGNDLTDSVSSNRLLQPLADGRSNDALGRARGPRADWDHLPPTDSQSRYIRVLGGDVADARTKAEASDLIDRLRRLKGPSPLDPYNLEKRGARAGSEAGPDWKSAHDSLLSGLRLDLQQYVDTTLDSLQAKLSDSCGPSGVRQIFGPQNLVREAGLHLERLRVWRHHGERSGVPIPDVSQLFTESAAEGVTGREQVVDPSPKEVLSIGSEEPRDASE